MADEPTAEQKAAIDSREKDILLEAGAGTGKTRTTVDRYAALLKEGVPASKIMVFTFTEKAANELRERVRTEVPGESGQAFSMSHAWIGTFHSICASILRAHPMEADVDPTFTILDDIQSSLLKSDSYDRALSRFMNSDERLKLISGFYAPNLQKGVSNAFEQLRSRGQIIPKLPVPKGNDLGEAIDALTLECARTKALGGPNAATIAKIERLEQYLGKTPVDKVTFKDFGEEAIASGSHYLTKVLAAMKRCQAVLAEREFGEENRVTLAELLETYSEVYSEAKRATNLLDYEDLQLKTLSLLTDGKNASIGERYRTQFDEIMVDEFQDTNQLQIDLIEALCGESTRFFTVGDEMQAIYGFRHADIRLFRKRRQVEGLDKLGLTANFRSEPAIIGAVDRIGQSLDDELGELRDAEKPDEDDRRSNEDGNLDRHEFKSLRAGREESSGDDVQVEILFTQKEGWAELNLGPLWPGADPATPGVTNSSGGPEAEALLLAHHIKATLAETGIKPSETAILFKAKARMPLFAEALTQVGLRPYIIGGSGFWESREGVGLRSLLAVVANPLDDESLIAALAGPACGLSTDAMFLLRRSSRKTPLWEALTHFASGLPEGNPSAALGGSLPDDHKLAAAFVNAINSIRNRAASLPLGELVEATVTATGYDLVNLIRDPEATGLANMKRIASLASRYESNEGRDLRGFLKWADLSARLDAEDAVATQEEDSDVVRLMTIHKAKGLEFELVCVADLGRGKNNQGETVFWIGPNPESENEDEDELLFGMKLPQPDGSSLDLFDWTALSEAAKRERTEEEMRLFHVALTRAKRRLVMSAVVDLDDPQMDDGTSIASNLACVLGINDNTPESVDVPAPELLSGATGEETRIPVRRNFADEDQEAHLSRIFDPAPAVESESDGQPPLWRPETPAFPNVPLSFTALSEFMECPARFYAKRILRLKEPTELAPEVPELSLSSTTSPEEQSLNARDDGTKFGSAIHELLEASAERRWVRPTDGEVEKRLNRLGVDLADGASLKRAREMIDGFFDSELGKRAQAARCEIEIPLLVRAGQVTIRGLADLFIPESDPPLVLDYKTNRLGDKAPAEKMADYELQRNLYALAVQRASGVETVETAFVFLERPHEPVLNVLNRSDLDRGQEKLLAVVREIELGHFFGGPGADQQPCGDCWACSTLTSRISAA